ncbi:hypothetical protein B0T19DRAFT_409122 [Cercophora scortea]|uniref:Uncharacterized protein n=1 Tax=Cercophora scortea TaxID=314031 RepID=A0AAE0J4B9_9PEZI|nr:hypothetical protein B0T19DRAFT_409122 [Cercophora scortea]
MHPLFKPSSAAFTTTLFRTVVCSSTARAFTPRRTMTTGIPSTTAKAQQSAESKSTNGPTFDSVGVKNTNINEAAGVKLSSHQRVLVGSVLDLFAGNPTLKHLALWSPEATFTDPITISQGYPKYSAQWYGLPAVFNPINIVSHQVVAAGNPIELDLRNRYTIKGIKTEQEIASRVRIFVDESSGKIEKVEDRWNDSLPDGPISQAFRKLNAVTVPMIVKVPKSEEEDRKMQAEREGR